MKDLALDSNNDLAFADGDVRIFESDEQNKRLLLVCNKASIKEFPLACVGTVNYLESEDPAAFLREVRDQFTGDGMTVNRIKFNDNLTIDASY